MSSVLILDAEVTTGEPSLKEVSASLWDAPGLLMAFRALWEPWTEKSKPGNVCSREFNGKNYFPLSGASLQGQKIGRWESILLPVYP